MGYSLNQKGLFSGVVRDPRDRRIKLNTGMPLVFSTNLSNEKYQQGHWSPLKPKKKYSES